MTRHFRHDDEGESTAAAFDTARRKHETDTLLTQAEQYLAGLADREARREEVLLRHGFDIGTRQEAITMTGPYQDQANADRIALFFMERRIGFTKLERKGEDA
ncbi:hypothetical protein [Frigoribacterium sp. CG_9.8]|uniref:hypothetical protein n=1 Tax=Frigoribacterium sp. CG_9.8 TaxID=2787733 RepID=UPI0018CBD5DE|nr:hypothetical protein [Frigoribacterium sp. CG_9.8]MBG6106589.1 hypothetical protein [Frigoribacterium sp. CG_9.8]